MRDRTNASLAFFGHRTVTLYHVTSMVVGVATEMIQVTKDT